MMVKLCWRKIYLEICTNTCAWKYTGNMNLEYTPGNALTGMSWKYYGKSTCNLYGLWLTMTNEHLANKFIHVLMVTRPYWSRAADVLAPVRVEQNNYTRALQIQYSCDLRLCVVSNRIITCAPYKYNTLVIFGFQQNNSAGATILL